MEPDKNKLELNLYVDADFVGLFTSEDRDNPISVKSRTMLLLIFGDVPVFWSSKLQSKIALHT